MTAFTQRDQDSDFFEIVPKTVIDNSPSFWPILSAIGTPKYSIIKFLISV